MEHKCKKLGNLNGFTGGNFAYNIYDLNGDLAPTLNTCGGGGREPMIIETDYLPCAIRGRYVDENQIEQQLEVSDTPKVSNCITNVQKDSMILEKRRRIRKLTPIETWRLQGIKDEDFHKAEQVNSDTQLYKESGNGICVNVLMAIFSQLGIPGVPKWNDLSDEDKYALLGD